MENHHSHIGIWKTKPVLIEGASKKVLKGSSISSNNSCALSVSKGHINSKHDFLSVVVRNAGFSNAEA